MKEIICPSSKSCLQRLIICASLCKGTSIIKDVTLCDDVISCLKAINAYGATYELSNNNIIIHGYTNNVVNNVIVGESGTCCRLIIPVLLTFNKDFSVFGYGSLNNRNIRLGTDFIDSNCTFETVQNKLPIRLKGILSKNKYIIDGSATSQYVSGLLIAKSFQGEPFSIEVNNCTSIGYIKLTINVLKKFGTEIIIQKNSETSYILYSKNIELIPGIFTCEPDYSSLAAIYTSASLLSNEETCINGIVDSDQPDKAIIDFGKNVQNNIKISHNCLIINKLSKVKPFNVDIKNTPDLFPYYATLAACCDSLCEISGLSKLVNKECNRGQAIYNEFTKLGIYCEIIDDTIYIKKGLFIDKKYNSHNDHRIAMACIIAKLFYGGKIYSDEKCLNKSYPQFINMIKDIYGKQLRTYI